jgi:uncharacterized protein YecE (DUF72 family)
MRRRPSPQRRWPRRPSARAPAQPPAEAGVFSLPLCRRWILNGLFKMRCPGMSFVGTAGWAIPAPYRALFPGAGSQLERYGARLNGVEINTSFYRPHQRKTYQRWADSVPGDFRFSVKLPRTITHHHRLADSDALLDRFLEEVSGLGEKLGILLVQLPPSLAYDADVAKSFFHALSQAHVPVACEPRHASWFTAGADKVLNHLHVRRVAADPPRAPCDGEPGGDLSSAYWRLHGSPKIYYSDYPDQTLTQLSAKLGKKDWCIFDNTAAFHALGNAMRVIALQAGR